MSTAVESTPIIDTDAHVSEPPELWISRLPKKWADEAPRIRLNADRGGSEDWYLGDVRLFSAGFLAVAGHDDYAPDFPKGYADFDPAAWKVKDRLERMDEHGVYAEVLFPNVLCFYNWAFREMANQELSLACHRVYNDYAVEFASADPNRLIPLCILPYWNLEESVKELRRCHEMGHRGLIFGWQYHKVGLPPIMDPHWDPLFKTAEELEMSMNLHVALATQKETTEVWQTDNVWSSKDYARQSALSLLSNAEAIALLTTSGMLERYPNLKWLSVESGFGYLPFLLETLDWQWHNAGAFRDNPKQLLPSEAFRKHMYGSFWYESSTLSLLELFPDNILFETDFPHPTSLSPGPASTAQTARDTVRQSMKALPDDVIRKVLFENAAKLFKVDYPVG
jgi:uncharacterized protein